MTTNKEKIAKQAKKIMDDFKDALGKINSPEEFGIEREIQLRVKGDSLYLNFRERMLKNAKKKNDDFIIAEKKGW